MYLHLEKNMVTCTLCTVRDSREYIFLLILNFNSYVKKSFPGFIPKNKLISPYGG